LLIQGLRRLQNADRGFSPDNVVVMQIRGNGSQQTRPIASTAYEQYIDRIEAVAGVEAAASTTALPLRNPPGTEFAIDGRTRDPTDTARLLASYQIVSRNYFRVFRIPLREGRVISEDDVVERPRVAVINETLARRHWPDESPIGHRIRVGPDLLTVVGVVGDAPVLAVETGPSPQIYVSNMQRYEPNMNLVVRTVPGATVTADTIKKAVWAVSPNQALFNIQPMSQVVRVSVAEPRYVATLLGAFAALALLMSATGVYLIVWYLVTTRTARDCGAPCGRRACARHREAHLWPNAGLDDRGPGRRCGVGDCDERHCESHGPRHWRDRSTDHRRPCRFLPGCGKRGHVGAGCANAARDRSCERAAI